MAQYAYNPITNRLDLTNTTSPGGDVIGPGLSTDNALVRWDGITGKVIKNSNAILTDAGLLTLALALPATSGGTGQATYTTGDTLYASAANTLSKLPIGSTNQVLTVVGGIPAWANISQFSGTGSTIGAVTANILTIPLGAVAGTFQFEARVKGFNASTPAGCGYNVYGTFTTDGATATLVGNQDVFNENAALSAADAYFIASGNNAILQVLGVTGLTISWTAESDLT